MTLDLITIRLAASEDVSFVFSSALQSYFHTSRHVRRVPKDLFFKEHQKLLERLIAQPRSRLLVAADSGEPANILGYALFTGPCLHYAYIKKSLRRQGILATLLKAHGLSLGQCVISHLTPDMEAIFASHPGMIFNPYLLMGAWNPG